MGQRGVRDRLAALVDRFGPAASDRVVVLDGPPGIGRTGMLTAAADRARGAGLHVLGGRADERDAAFPGRTLGRLLTRPPADLVADDPASVAARCRGLVGQGARATVVVLDDVHLADEFSMGVLARLVRDPGPCPLLWMVAGRAGGQDRRLTQLLEHPGSTTVERLAVSPLDEAETEAVCRELLGGRPGPGLRGLLRGAGGVPSLLVELVGVLRRSDALRADGRVVEVAPGAPVAWGGITTRHLEELSAPARELVDAASVLAQPFGPEEVAGLLGRAVTELLDAVEEALRADLLLDTGGALRFRHEFVRLTVHESLGAARRRELHARAATQAEASGRPAAEVVEHLVHGDGLPGDDALELAAVVVRDLGPSAPDTAGDIVLRTVGKVGAGHPARAGLLADAVRLTAQAGRVCEARDIGEAALAGPDVPPDAQVRLLLALAVAHQLGGLSEQVVGLTTRALAVGDAEPGCVSDEDLADVLAIRAHAQLDLPHPVAAAVAATEAGRAADRAGRTASRVCALAVRGATALLAGNLAEAVRDGAAAVELAETAGDEARQRVPRLWLVPSLAAADRFDEAAAVLEVGRVEAEQLRAHWCGPAWRLSRAALHLATGRLGEARGEAEAGLGEADRLPTDSHRVDLHVLLAQIAVLARDPDGARRHAQRADELHRDGLAWSRGNPALLAGTMLLADGRAASAFAVLEPLYRDAVTLRALVAHDPAAPAVLARAALDGGDRVPGRRAALAVGAVVEASARRNPEVAGLGGAAAQVAGLLDGDAVRILVAAERFVLAGRPLAAAAAVADAHACDPAAVDPARLARARAVAAGAGARALVDRLPDRSTDTVRPADDPWWERLSDPERRVAELVVRGMTNREAARVLHLSPHTVDSHLRRCFGKLGVRSRVELAGKILPRARPVA